MALYENLFDYYSSTAYTNLVKLKNNVARLKIDLFAAYLFSGQCAIINGVAQYPAVVIEGVSSPINPLLFITGYNCLNNQITIADSKGYYKFDMDELIAILDELEVIEYHLKHPVVYIEKFWFMAKDKFSAHYKAYEND